MDTSSPMPKSSSTDISMTVDSGTPVHGRDVFKTGLACETPGARGPGGFNAMDVQVPHTRQWPTTSGIDHWRVRENFRHLTPSGTLLELDLAFARRAQISEDEEALLFAELIMAENPIVPLAAEFALETGCRRSEQLRIEWKDYDRRRGTVWLADAKNGRGRHILLSERAVQILEALPGRAAGGKIFKISSNALKKAFEYARARAARRARSMGREDLVSVGTLRWHDFRHEAISRCFDDGWTSEQVMDFSGHVDIKSLLRYRHPKVDQSVARLRAMKPNGQRTLPAPGVIEASVSGGGQEA